MNNITSAILNSKTDDFRKTIKMQLNLGLYCCNKDIVETIVILKNYPKLVEMFINALHTNLSQKERREQLLQIKGYVRCLFEYTNGNGDVGMSFFLIQNIIDENDKNKNVWYKKGKNI